MRGAHSTTPAILRFMIAYRKSWFDEVGSPTFPDTWEKYREVGKKLKAMGRPIGQTLGHTFGDAPTFSYPYLWSWGGSEIEKDGKTVNINKKEVIDSVKFMTAFWKEAHGGERRADRTGESSRQATRCHTSFPASRFRREDRSGNLTPAQGNLFPLCQAARLVLVAPVCDCRILAVLRPGSRWSARPPS